MNHYTRAWMADLPHGLSPISDDKLAELVSTATSVTLRAALTELQLRRDAAVAQALFADCTCDGTLICDACRRYLPNGSGCGC